MWQEKEITKLLMIGMLLTLLVKPYTGVSIDRNDTLLPDTSYYLPSNTISERSIQQGKMKLAIDKPMPEIRKTKQVSKTQEVASFTIYKPSTPPEEINLLIQKYAAEYNADPNIMASIAECESGFRQDAQNNNFAGMYQFLASTWESNRKAMGLDTNPELRFVAEEAIRTAAFKMGRDGYGAWPACYQQALASL